MASEIAIDERPLICSEEVLAMSTDTVMEVAQSTMSQDIAADSGSKDSDEVTSSVPMSPQSTFFKNVCIPVPDVFPQIPTSPKSQNTSPSPSKNFSATKDLTSKFDAVPVSSQHTVDIPASGVAIEESSSRVAVKFLVKKSKGFCGAIRFYLNKSVTANSSKFKSLMSSLKDSVKSTFANTVPSSETITHLTNSIVSTLKGRRLPNCLRFLKLSLTPYNKKKQLKNRDIPIIPMFLKKDLNGGTFLNPVKKPELDLLTGFQFAKPKIYTCSYCDTKFFKLPVYLKHIRRHAEIIRCESCGNAFSSIINKRRHQLQCRKRAI